MDKEIIKKIKPIWIVSFLLVICLIVITWEFGWKKLESSIYQKGFTAGQANINNQIIQNLNIFGQIRINVPDKDGKIQTIILVPQTQ